MKVQERAIVNKAGGVNPRPSSLKQLRKSLGLTQAQFAKLLGISRGHYSNLETLKRLPAVDIIAKIKNLSNDNPLAYSYIREVYEVAKNKNSKNSKKLIEYIESSSQADASNFASKNASIFSENASEASEETEAFDKIIDEIVQLVEAETQGNSNSIFNASNFSEAKDKVEAFEAKFEAKSEMLQLGDEVEAKEENEENNLAEAISKESLKKKESTKERKNINNINNNSNSYNNIASMKNNILNIGQEIKNSLRDAKSFAERLLLLNIIHKPEAKAYLEELDVEDIEPENRSLFLAIRSSEEITLSEIYFKLPKDEALQVVEDFTYFPKVEIEEIYRSYLKFLRELKLKRQVMELIEKDRLTPEALNELLSQNKMQESKDEARIDKIIDRFCESYASNKMKLETSMPELNKMLEGGFTKGQYVIIAARPSVGKTTLALNYALDFALKGKEVVFFSLEQSEIEIVHRLACIIASKKLTEYHEMEPYLAELSKLNLYVYAGSYSASKIESILKSHHPKVDAVVIDYFQLIQTPNKFNSLVQEYSQISSTLKRIAKELDTVVIVASQLNRDVEKREISIPRLSDLRETGALEQDSDVVLLLSILSQPSDDIARLRISVAKNRNGATGFFYATFYKPYFKIVEEK